MRSNRFFTLLLAASCLTAVGQSGVCNYPILQVPQVVLLEGNGVWLSATSSDPLIWNLDVVADSIFVTSCGIYEVQELIDWGNGLITPCAFISVISVVSEECPETLIPSFCGEGTVWDIATSTCISANTADINNDGCVQLNDLLDLLTAYGDCGAEESAWQCGNPLEYQGYDYETVQIGEQCWFAENLRSTHYREGSPISEVPLADGAWESAIQGSYGFCSIELGAHYNFLAVTDQRGLCPTGWHVPAKGEFFEIFNLVDQSVAAAHLKSSVHWDGIDSFGLNVRPAGTHRGSYCVDVDDDTRLWTSTPYSAQNAWNMDFSTGANYLLSHQNQKYYGWSVRCIKDTE